MRQRRAQDVLRVTLGGSSPASVCRADHDDTAGRFILTMMQAHVNYANGGRKVSEDMLMHRAGSQLVYGACEAMINGEPSKV